jgi:hypothetical protein
MLTYSVIVTTASLCRRTRSALTLFRPSLCHHTAAAGLAKSSTTYSEGRVDFTDPSVYIPLPGELSIQDNFTDPIVSNTVFSRVSFKNPSTFFFLAKSIISALLGFTEFLCPTPSLYHI